MKEEAKQEIELKKEVKKKKSLYRWIRRFFILILTLGIIIAIARPVSSNLLPIAAQFGSSKYVKLLLAMGADPNAKVIYSNTALIEAASSGSAECVKLLIDAGADINAKEKNLYGDETTAMIKAARNGASECVRLLLDAGADPNDGALQSAASSGSAECVRLLLDAGADPNATKDEDRNSISNRSNFEF